MNKQDLRRHMKEVRASVSDRKHKSKQICEYIIRSKSYQECDVLLIYLAIGSEVSLDTLIEQAETDYKIVAAPRITGPRKMEFHILEGPLEEGSFHTRQPSAEAPLSGYENKKTLMITPGLAFTKDGKRLGYGGGYYDTFLSQIQKSMTLYGVAFEEQIIRYIPTEEHDRCIDNLVTPGGIYDCICTGNPETN